MNKLTGSKIFYAVILCLFIQNTFAQKVYVSLNGGYNYSMSPTTDYTSNYVNGYTTLEKVELSLGKGTSVGGTIGYKINQNIGIELGCSYLVSDVTTWHSSNHLDLLGTIYRDKSFSSTMLRFTPNLVLSTSKNKLNFYTKTGPIFGYGSYLINEEGRGDFANSLTSTKTTRYDGGFALGINSSLGINYKINKNFTAFFEFNCINLSYAANKSEVIKNIVGGDDLLPGMNTYDKKSECVDNYSSSPFYDPNQPRKEIKQYISYSTIGFNLGVTYHF